MFLPLDYTRTLVVYSGSMLNKLMIVTLAAALAACSPQVASRGHLDVTKKLGEVHTGETHKQDVIRLFGTPSLRSSFGDETWYYISAKRESYAFFRPETTEQKVVAIQFDSNDMVTGVKQFDKKDSQDLAVVEKTTPTEGQELGLWEQMLGNFGRFNSSRTGTAGSVGGSPGGSLPGR